MSSPETPARRTAFEILTAVLRRKRPLDEVLEKLPALSGMEARERAFARVLVMTALRRLGQIDQLIDHCLERPLPAKARPVHDLLRLGVCQLLFLETPPHAAVDTTVALAENLGHGPHKKLVNAVLRRLGREGRALLEKQDPAFLNTPGWLWQSWAAAYGEETCRQIADAHLGEPPLDISAKRDTETWAARLSAKMLPTGTLRLYPRGPVTDLPGYEEGAWWVQDAAAALPVRLLGDVGGARVIDLCAAPGGKTAQLAAAGARVTAVERTPGRMRRLEENLSRLGLTAETVIADAADWRPAEPADAVVLDAPCSATGTLRRHPDVARLKSPNDVARLAEVQDRLLRAAAEMVRPGGRLVYCTCSLQPEEGPERIAAFLGSGPGFERIPAEASLVGGWEACIAPDGTLRTLPCHLSGEGGMDGFFAACLERRH